MAPPGMSIKIMSAVWERAFTHAEKLVLLAMADHANDEGRRCYPSVEKIAWKSGYSRRQVQRIIHDLTDRGVLTVEAEATWISPTEYAIHPEAAPPLPPFHPKRLRDAVRTGGGDEMSPHANHGTQGVPSGTEGVPFTARTMSQMAPEPSEEPKTEEPFIEPPPPPPPNPPNIGYLSLLGEAAAGKIIADFSRLNTEYGTYWLADALGQCPKGLDRPRLVKGLRLAYSRMAHAFQTAGGDYPIRNPRAFGTIKVKQALEEVTS